MTREETKKLLPIMEAYSEGKTVQIWNESKSKWVDLDEASFSASPDKYRIKLKPKYRPFKNREECWNEMQKHQPFGWIRDNNTKRLCNIGSIGHNNYGITINNTILYFDFAFNTCNFADGTPFGIKED